MYYKNPLYNRNKHLKKRYGITIEDFKIMLEKQNYKCVLCSNKATVIDHCHRSGKIRGVLCRRCNSFLAPLESPDWLVKAAGYLHQHWPERVEE